MATAPTQASKFRKAARNRLLLEQHQSGMPIADLACLHGLSQSRVSMLLALENKRVAREAELTLADSLPVQPNPLHLSLKTRTMVAEAVGRHDFTRGDVRAAGMAKIVRVAGFYGPHRRELLAWLDRPGDQDKLRHG